MSSPGNSAAQGGAIYNDTSSPSVSGCAFGANTAQSGGAVYNIDSAPRFINCTFAGNSATGTSDSAGGALANDASSPTLVNCIVWSNTAVVAPQIHQAGGVTTASTCDIQGGFPGAANFNLAPKFVTSPTPAQGSTPASAGDLHLQPSSPCIDIGNNSAVPSSLTTDPDGNPRFTDYPGVQAPGAIVDLGAYELPFASLDANGLLSVFGGVQADRISLTASHGVLSVTVNDQTRTFTPRSVKSIRIDALAGDDSVTLGAGIIGASIYGGDGNDSLLGGPGKDVLYGGDGDDSLYGGLGGDSLYGEAGSDSLVGDQGHDLLNGGLGADTLLGALGNDSLEGGKGRDYLDASDGNDSLTGGLGRDLLVGGAGTNAFATRDGLADTLDGAAASAVDATDVVLPPGWVDEAWYRQAYPDVAAAIDRGTFASAYQHFAFHGLSEGRNPSPWFDQTWYRAQNADVGAALAAGSLESAFQHYLLWGQQEQRDPSPLFDESWYLTQNPDVAAALAARAFRSGFEHFIVYGQTEFRDPAPRAP